jgi:hypothetical protein
MFQLVNAAIRGFCVAADAGELSTPLATLCPPRRCI